MSPKEGTEHSNLPKKLVAPYSDIQLGNDYHNMLVHRENVKQLIRTSTQADGHLMPNKEKKVVTLIANGIKKEKAQA